MIPRSVPKPSAPSPADLFDDAPAQETPEALPSDLFQDHSPPESISRPSPARSQPDFDERSVEPTQAGSLTGPTETDAETEPETDFSKSGAEIQAEIEEALRNNPPLPSLDGSESIPPSLGNPLGDPQLGNGLDAPANRGRDLSETNGVDCQLATKACNDDFAAIRKRELTDMSIDITPSIEPREFDMARVDQIREEKLADAAPRPWRDRKGNVIADGTLEDFRFGQVIVRTVNGTERKISEHKLSDADRCYVNAWWELPEECNFEGEQFVMRDFRMSTFTWTAAATCHKPLFFEEVSLERYGHTAGPLVQPIVSGAHFFGNVFMLPYHAGLTPPNECIYPLGYYRPGECAPWIVPGFPMSSRGFKWQGLALGAGIALLP